MNGRISKEALKNRTLRQKRKAALKAAREASVLQKSEKKSPPVGTVTKTGSDPDVKRIQISELHKGPPQKVDPPAEVDRRQDKSASEPDTVPSCVIDGTLRCPRCGFADLQSAEQDNLMLCPVCGMLSQVPETDAADSYSSDEPKHAQTWMIDPNF